MSEIINSLQANENIAPDTVTEAKANEAMLRVHSETRENLAQLKASLDAQITRLRTELTGINPAQVARVKTYNDAIARLELVKSTIDLRAQATAPGDYERLGSSAANTARLTVSATDTATRSIAAVPVLGTLLVGTGIVSWLGRVWGWFGGKKKKDKKKKAESE